MTKGRYLQLTEIPSLKQQKSNTNNRIAELLSRSQFRNKPELEKRELQDTMRILDENLLPHPLVYIVFAKVCQSLLNVNLLDGRLSFV